MKFTLDQPGRVNVVASHRRGELRVGERVVVSSAIVTADRLLEGRQPPLGHRKVIFTIVSHVYQ